MSEERDYLVTVCDACRTASCWHGDLVCASGARASTRDVLASVLRGECREHADNFSVATLHRVCGSVRYVVQEQSMSGEEATGDRDADCLKCAAQKMISEVKP